MTPDPAALSTDTCTLPDGRTLSYATGGDPDGSPVVVHHGTPGSRLFGALLAAPVTEVGVRILVPDRPGYGGSSPPAEEWSWRAWPADIGALLDAELVDRAGALGFSGGSPFALAAASDDRVARVGLVSSVVPAAENALATLASAPFALRVLSRLSEAFASVSGPDAVVSQYTDRSVSDAVAEAVAAGFHEALDRGARAVERENRALATASFDPPRVRSPAPRLARHGRREHAAPARFAPSFGNWTERWRPSTPTTSVRSSTGDRRRWSGSAKRSDRADAAPLLGAACSLIRIPLAFSLLSLVAENGPGGIHASEASVG